MIEDKVPYKKQIFVCTNKKHGNGKCCGLTGGVAIFKKLRFIAKEKGIHPTVRVAQAKCLGNCEQGVNIMVYGQKQEKSNCDQYENIWYKNVNIDDVDELAKFHIC